MAIEKSFVIKNGLEVSTNLIFANVTQNKVGIATTTLTHTLTVNGDISATGIVSATNAIVNNQLTLKGPLAIGSTTGADGAYLVSTGAGVTWKAIPTLRTTETFTATASQTTFNFSYNPVAGVDVFINGVRLSASEFTASNGTTVVLDDACFVGDTVDLVAYSIAGLGLGVTGITGLTIQNEGVSVGNDGNIVSLNFVGPNVTSTLSGFGVTVSLSDYVSSSGVATYASTAGVATYSSSSGIATYANISGIATNVIGGIASVTSVTAGIVTATSGFISIANTTPIQISLIGNQLTFTAVGIGSTTFTLF